MTSSASSPTERLDTLAQTLVEGGANLLRGAEHLVRQLPVSMPGSGGASIRMVPIDEVLYLQAADKYVRVVTADGEHLLRTPLKDLLPQLDAQQFWQIHRAILVRADAIDIVQRDEAGRLRLSLRGSPEWLAVSRLYAHRFKAM